MAPEKLLNLWKREEISVEMAIGHILQNLVKLETAHDVYTITVDNLQANVNDLIVHTEMEPRSKSKRTRPKSG
jgi:ribosomal protein S17